MKTVLCYPGNMAHAQQAARALFEAGALEAFVTAFVFRDDGVLAFLLRTLPEERGRGLSRNLERRKISQVPPRLVRSYPFWEAARSVLARSGASPVLIDRAWDRMAHAFDARAAQRHVPRAQAVVAFEYTALASFTRAKAEGVARVLHLPSLDSRAFDEIERREKAAWPELAGRHDAYFAGKFERRYARRRAEIARADVIIANSALTRRSHVAAGADPEKVFAVPLGAPPPIGEAGLRDERRGKPLSIVWAGTFMPRKGAHYFLEAWRALRPRQSARATIFGQVVVPERLLASPPEGLEFRGSVPRSELFAAYETADVLVFPTLSDGFGMVVAEALAHGLPVITTDQAGASDLIEHGHNGLVIPAGNADALKEALQWCLDNRAALQEMRFAALETARRHQWSDFRRRLIEAYDTGLRRAGYAPRFFAGQR